MEPSSQADDWKAPYLSYQTLTSFIDNKLGSNPLPPRIDRGFLDSYAGSVQAQLLQALKTIGLITDTGAVTEMLRQAASHPNGRKAVLKGWAAEFYAEQSELAKANGTAQMLHESFAKHKYSGSTLRKAIVFYLTLADEVGLPKSPHFKPPKQAPTTSTPRIRKKPDVLPRPSVTAEPSYTVTTSGERKTVDFGEAGRVTIEVDVKWLDLPIDVFTKLRALVQDLESLATPGNGSEDEYAPEEPL